MERAARPVQRKEEALRFLFRSIRPGRAELGLIITRINPIAVATDYSAGYYSHIEATTTGFKHTLTITNLNRMKTISTLSISALALMSFGTLSTAQEPPP